MLYTTLAQYTVAITTTPEDVTTALRERAVFHYSLHHSEPDYNYLAVGITDCGLSPDLLIEGWYKPGPQQGFHPGVLLVPESSTAFIGAGTELLIYSLAPIQLLSHQQTECGFWSWRRVDNLIVMSAELELAVWNIHGEKLWSRFVEPPWHYDIEGDTLLLNIMGNSIRLTLATGLIIEEQA